MEPGAQDLFQAIDRAFLVHQASLEHVRGSFLLHVFDGETRTVVTRGARKGIYAEATDDLVDCSVCAESWALMALLDPKSELETEVLVEQGALVIEGDLSIFTRFLELAQPRSALSLRSGRVS